MRYKTECGLVAGDKVKINLPKDDWFGLSGIIHTVDTPRTVTVKHDGKKLYYCVAALEKCD
jgi:hypothetical protein